MKPFFSMLLSALLVLIMILSAGCDSPAPAIQSVSTTRDALLPSPSPQPSAVLNASIWTHVLDCHITHPAYLAGFLNEKFGITVGLDGEIHYTRDGGQTWEQADNSSGNRYCLDIVDERIVWSSGYKYSVRKSSDGGETWAPVNEINLIVSHSNIDFIDENTGWVSTTYALASTSDGGQTWTKIALPEDADDITAISLRTPENGYFLSRDGMLYATTDGGTTWSPHNLGFDQFDLADLEKQPKLKKSNMSLADVSFRDENNGMVVFTGPAASLLEYHAWCMTTHDGGASWESELIPTPDIQPSRVYLTGDGQYLTLSDDSGNLLVLKRKA